MLVPKGSPRLGKPPAGFRKQAIASGALLRAKAPDPWAVTPASMDSLEAYLAPALGQR